MKSQCKGCTKRYVGCHDHCEHYKAFCSWVHEIKAARKQEMLKDFFAYERHRMALAIKYRSFKRKL